MATPPSEALPSSTSPPSASSRNVLKPPSLRRRRSKGTIAGFASGGFDAGGANPNDRESKMNGSDGTSLLSPSSEAGSSTPNATGGSEGHQPQHEGAPIPPATPSKPCVSARLSLLSVQNALRMGARTQLGLSPPGRSRRTLQNALAQVRSRGSRRPPRPKLLSVRSVSITSSASNRASLAEGSSDIGGYYGLDKMVGEINLAAYEAREEEYLLQTDPDHDHEMEYAEDASSGDEDDLDDLDALLPDDGSMATSGSITSLTSPKEVSPHRVDDLGEKYRKLREPLYTPTGTDPTVSNNANGATPGIANNSTGSGKLPFNRRKIKWFDSVTAADRAAAREYLREEMDRAKKRDGAVLARHLKRMQRREKRRILTERGQKDGAGAEEFMSDEETNDDMVSEALGIATCVNRMNHPMTPSLSAALVMESLSLHPLESIEGMAKCYDGIVAAGLALLDAESMDLDPGSASAGLDAVAPSQEKKKRPSRSEIMTALAPLLITSLEQPSGEVIVCLARMRRLCGTARYKRRFVQRIAPCLVRPPSGAAWCPRHQNDMEPILAATELIFDCAFEVFASGWYDRGRMLLADNVRAETLRTAADQLKRLGSSEGGASGLGLGGLNAGPGGVHGHRRGNSLMTGGKDGHHHHHPHGHAKNANTSEQLAEWEVLAVDRQIRTSISHIFSRDWSRVVPIPPRDGSDHSTGSRSHRRGISSTAGGTAKKRSGEATSSAAAAAAGSSSLPQLTEGSDIVMPSATPSPLSPPRNPLSPSAPNLGVGSSTPPPPTVEIIESTFGPSFAAQPLSPSVAVAGSPNTSPPQPPAPASTPVSPPLPRRPGMEGESGERAGSGAGAGVGALTPPHTPMPQRLGEGSVQQGTPPRSPSSPPRGTVGGAGAGALAVATTPGGSRKGTTTPPLSGQLTQGQNGGEFLMQAPQLPLMSPTNSSQQPTLEGTVGGSHRAPLSPSNASIGSTTTQESAATGIHHRVTSGSGSGASIGSGGGGASTSSSAAQTAHYRMLTSTAAERKRTVAACRALRAQISRFEEAFVQLHGRPPKGAAERAPLATTYAQYREWKRAIRADAACRIQALFRGARTRWVLLRSNNPRVSRVVMNKAGRPGLRPGGIASGIAPVEGGENVLKRLSIPVEIGGSESEQAPGAGPGGMGGLPLHGGTGAGVIPTPTGSLLSGDEGSEVSSSGVEVFISPPGSVASTPSLSPNWTTTPTALPMSRRDKPAVSSLPQHYQSPAASPVGESSMSLQELQARKRELKQQLKQYDMNFAREHGRMPVKAEKEPIRHLYESYNNLKGQISLLEREGGGHQGGPVPYRRSGSGLSAGSPDSSGDDSPTNAHGTSRGGVKKKPLKSPQPHEAPTTPTGTPSQDLAALKAEKGTLHQMLRSYEKDFFKEHKRQVSSFADIRPVASQYRRYKEIKKAIAALQQQQPSGEK